MAREYTAVFDAVAVTAEQDFFEILAPATAAIRLLEVHIGQETEEGDTQAEMLAWKMVYGAGSVTSGSGGSTATPRPTHEGYGASGATIEINNTTKLAAGTGTLTTKWGGAFHVAAGLHWPPKPKGELVISPSEYLTVELAEAPADSITFTGTILFEEIGG